MSNFETIKYKLEAFIKKFYTNELIRGLILFVAIGFLYFLFTLFIEYVLWLNPMARTVLFWLFISVEIALFTKFIAFPLLKLFKLQNGINFLDASKIIGQYFPEVNDKLVNILQLKESSDQSELLLASIDQKSIELKPIPFKLAINFKDNIKYLKYAAIPIVILAVSFVSGKMNWFSDSYERVLNHNIAYKPPAPFQFLIMNESLNAIENQDFKLIITTEGEITPENVQISFNNETYFLNQISSNEFEYVFAQPKLNINFNVFANNVASKTHMLNVVEVPILLGFDMVLDYPAHTKKKDETLKNTGNAIVPQGTNITWKLKTKTTTHVDLKTKDSIYSFISDNEKFELTQRLYGGLDYEINTSNDNIKNHESLTFAVDVIRDEFPELKVEVKQDSMDVETLYFYGQISDDYGLSRLELVYYPSNVEDNKKVSSIPISNSNFDEFINIFPGDLELEEGISYDLYFQIFDNDAINRYKRTKSNVFSYRKLTQEELEIEQLKEQNETIEDLNKSLEKLEKQDEELKEFSKTQKEKSELNFNDKKKLENFLKRQKQQEEVMQNFNKKLKENLNDFQKEENKKDEFKENIEKRLDENQKQLEEDEKLLEELEKLAEKIQKEELTQKLEELAKQNKNKKRSLEQLLELTKRYYISKKAEKLKVELEKLSEEQEKLSEETNENNTKEEQDKLNDKFEDFQKEMDDLQKENQELKEPIKDVKQDKASEEEVKKEQQEASDNLEKKEQAPSKEEEKENQNNAKKNQKKAAQKMKEMSEEMSQMMSGGGGGEQMSEDIDMLRQILDNLVLFSFDQEDLMNRFKSIQINHNEYANYLKNQQSLKEHFEHVDDSLFALSLRQPMISERINKEITEVFFNIDKSLGQLAENRLYQGVAAQQYTVTSANTLASFLSDVLDNMENQMNLSPGQGGDGDMQLPDIIMSQEELNKQMEEGLKKSEEGKKSEGEKGNEGEKKGNKEGKQQGGEGEGNSEDSNGELFRIYQQQQQLRQALEDRLAKEGKDGVGGNLLKKMEQVEKDLLDKGFTNGTLQKMMDLQHQLLKLENATFQQGEDQKRKSETNQKQFKNASLNQINNAKQYFNTTEILNRQTLPLQQEYKKKVQDYFKKKNDQF